MISIDKAIITKSLSHSLQMW